MTTITTKTSLADAVPAAFLRGDADTIADLCADDVLVDLVVPRWHFQLSGREDYRQALAQSTRTVGEKAGNRGAPIAGFLPNGWPQTTWHARAQARSV